MTASATGRFARLDGRDCIAFTRTFDAPIEAVWAAVTESERLARWIGTWTGDPTTGSVQFSMNAEGEAAAAAAWEITECLPPRRVGVHAVDEYGVWTLVVDLADGSDSVPEAPGASGASGVTTLTLWHVIDDVNAIENIGPGWDYYLDRLVAAESGADPNALDFDRDYYPALREHYVSIAEHLRPSARAPQG